MGRICSCLAYAIFTHSNVADSEAVAIVVDMSKNAWQEIDDSRSLNSAMHSSAEGSSVGFEKRCSSSEFCVALELFVAALCLANRGNTVAVIARNDSEGGYIFPVTQGGNADADLQARPATVRSALRSGLDSLRGVQAQDQQQQQDEADMLFEKTAWDLKFDSRYASLSSCVSLALLHLNRQRASRHAGGQGGGGGGGHFRGRLIVFQAGPDIPAQYISLINSTYSCQRLGVVLDSVVLCEAPSVLLQQAAHLTGGLHLHPAVQHHAHLLQYILTLLLPDALSRRDMRLPPSHGVDMRAHCFCHKRHVTQAWLCTICLSVWCHKMARCPTCGTGGAEQAITGPS